MNEQDITLWCYEWDKHGHLAKPDEDGAEKFVRFLVPGSTHPQDFDLPESPLKPIDDIVNQILGDDWQSLPFMKQVPSQGDIWKEVRRRKES